jgi:flagellar motor switch protein FliN/FliY
MRSLEEFKEIQLKLTLILGKKEMYLSKVLNLKKGDLIVFDTKLDDYLKVTLNESDFGVAEIIVINNKFGLRLVDLV